MTIKRKNKFIILPKIVVQDTNLEENKPQEQDSNKKIKR